MIDNQYIINQCNTLIEHGYAKSLASIAVKCGQSKQYFSDLKKNKARFSLSFLDSLEQNFPIIRREYALNGEGNPFKDDYETTQNDAHKADKLNRILELKAALGCKTDIEFTRLINLTPQSYSSIMKGTRPMGVDIFYKILVNIPNVNPQWLEYGEGNMFLDRSKSTPKPLDPMDVIEDLRYTVDLQKDYINNLKNQIKRGCVPQAGNVSCADAV